MPDASSIKTILTADIGGTNSRFALFQLDTAHASPLKTLRFVRRTRFATPSGGSTAGMMHALTAKRGDGGGGFMPASAEPVHVDAAVFGIPCPNTVADMAQTPPRGEVYRCPNIDWPLEAGTIMDALEGAPVRFINDFVANGFACALLPHVIDAVTVLPGNDRPGFPRAVVGAGTGLGHCLVLPGEFPVVVGAEAGHALFCFTREEEDLYRFLTALHGTDRINGDKAIAGHGLANLYAYCTGKTVHPHEVAPLAAENEQVMELAARLYGRAVLHYALNTLPLGGVFITGGLAANLPGVLTHPAFAAELREKNPMGRSLGPIPVMHVRNTDIGLWGAAACASILIR